MIPDWETKILHAMQLEKIIAYVLATPDSWDCEVIIVTRAIMKTINESEKNLPIMRET